MHSIEIATCGLLQSLHVRFGCGFDTILLYFVAILDCEHVSLKIEEHLVEPYEQRISMIAEKTVVVLRFHHLRFGARLERPIHLSQLCSWCEELQHLPAGYAAMDGPICRSQVVGLYLGPLGLDLFC